MRQGFHARQAEEAASALHRVQVPQDGGACAGIAVLVRLADNEHIDGPEHLGSLSQKRPAQLVQGHGLIPVQRAAAHLCRRAMPQCLTGTLKID
jgi:hypothetical protein